MTASHRAGSRHSATASRPLYARPKISISGRSMFKAISSRVIGFMAIGSVLLPLSISQIVSIMPAVPGNGNHPDISPHGAGCGWSHYDPACLHDGTHDTVEVHKVRVIVIDRSRTLDEPTAPNLQPHQSSKHRDRCASLPPSCWSPQRMRAGNAIGGHAKMANRAMLRTQPLV